jgi:hypothetical protein
MLRGVLPEVTAMLFRLLPCIVLIGTQALADVPGIRFDEMPVGCNIHGRYSTGEVTVDHYVGPSGAKHIVKTYGVDGLLRTSTYSKDGLLLRKDWAGGEWETFKPASCVNVPGPCSYTYRNGDGAVLEYRGENTRKGDKIVNEGGFVGEAPFNPVVSTVGRFNAQTAFSEGATAFKVTKYEDCDVGS